VKYSEDIANKICNHLAEGNSLRSITQVDGMPSLEAVRLWLRTKEDFLAQYMRAREEQADHYADEIIDIADTEEDPNIARVRIDARKWVAAKLKPKRYGDKLDIDHTTAGEKITPTIILESTNAINDRYGFNSSLETGAEASDGV
jgi:hypothetical protein